MAIYGRSQMFSRTEAERLQSDVGVIPIFLWNEMFERQIATYELEFLRTELEKIDKKTGAKPVHKVMSAAASCVFSEEEYDRYEFELIKTNAANDRAWENSPIKRSLCLLLGHQKASPTDLLRVGLLSLRLSDILEAALLANRPDIFDVAAKTPGMLGENPSLSYLCFQYACELGCFEALKKVSLIDPKSILSIIKYGYCRAAANGHLQIIQWLHTESTTEQLKQCLASKKDEAYGLASRHKRDDVMEYLSGGAGEQDREAASTTGLGP